MTPLSDDDRPTPGAALCRWVDNAACTSRLDLPWTEDANKVTEDDRQAMATVCTACPVAGLCEAYADLLEATAAYWAGRHRDLPAPAEAEWPGIAWEPVVVRPARRTAPAAVSTWEQSALSLDGLDGAA